MSEHGVTPPLVLQLDERQWAWLRETGAPAATMLALLEHAIRQDILKRALRDEHAIELLIRRQHKELKRRFGDSRAMGKPSDSLRAVAEDEMLRTCESMQDMTMRAAAARLRLRFAIERGQAGDAVAARVKLQSLREQRPGGWREVLCDRPA